MNAHQLLASSAMQMGIAISKEEQLKLIEYIKLLQKWNKVYSLTAIRQLELMITHHLLDSLAVLPHLWPARWLDVGCGPGLPGLVLAVMRPEWAFTLLDSNSKKTSFVQQAIIELGIHNASVCCARVEDWQSNEKFDGIISRAFAKVEEFTRLTRHLLKSNGKWVAMKGVPDLELAELPKGLMMESVLPLQIPGLDALRCLVIVKDSLGCH
jgi:16S rRNA (guanine527-N7)-methyltransferase